MDALEPTLRGEVADRGESGSYRQLMLPEIRATAEQLVRRIEERFPGAGLVGVMPPSSIFGRSLAWLSTLSAAIL